MKTLAPYVLSALAAVVAAGLERPSDAKSAALAVPPGATPTKIARNDRNIVVTVRVKKAPGAEFVRTPESGRSLDPRTGQPLYGPIPTESGVFVTPAHPHSPAWYFKFSDGHLQLLNEEMQKPVPGDVHLKWDLGAVPPDSLPKPGWKAEATSVIWVKRGPRTFDLSTCVSETQIQITN